ncbi:DNA polymerase III subunit delta [Massilia sp. W12]|uniref:DNA polymerase III subunit delta n=1 Tax=Massilia sp. W12 TaxID=3126507 RepID=UPI0030CB7DBC
MQLRAEQLKAHLQAGRLASLYVIASDEHLLALEAADAIRAAARTQGYTEREVLHVERNFKWGQLAAACQSQSLFGDRKILELRMPGGKPGVEGARMLQDLPPLLGDDTLCLLSMPKPDWQTQKAAWVQSLQQHAAYLEIPLVERARLPAWIEERLSLQQQSASREGLDFIANRVEGNLLAAHQEIMKLGLLHGPGKLELEDIHASVLNVARYDVFKLSEAMLKGEPLRVARMLQGLQGEGEALPLILWAMTEEVRTLLKLKCAQARGAQLAQAMKENRVFGPRERLIGDALRRLSLAQLQAALRQAAQIDKIIKGLKSRQLSGDCWDALLQLGLAIAR